MCNGLEEYLLQSKQEHDLVICIQWKASLYTKYVPTSQKGTTTPGWERAWRASKAGRRNSGGRRGRSMLVEVEHSSTFPSARSLFLAWKRRSATKAAMAEEAACVAESAIVSESALVSRIGGRAEGARQESWGRRERGSAATLSSPGRCWISCLNSET